MESSGFLRRWWQRIAPTFFIFSSYQHLNLDEHSQLVQQVIFVSGTFITGLISFALRSYASSLHTIFSSSLSSSHHTQRVKESVACAIEEKLSFKVSVLVFTSCLFLRSRFHWRILRVSSQKHRALRKQERKKVFQFWTTSKQQRVNQQEDGKKSSPEIPYAKKILPFLLDLLIKAWNYSIWR